MSLHDLSSPEDLLASAKSLRWQIGGDFNEKLMEAIYADAATIADRTVTRPGEKPRFDLDRTIDRVVTSRVWGFPLMILLVTVIGSEGLKVFKPNPLSLPPENVLPVTLYAEPDPVNCASSTQKSTHAI